MAALDVIFRGLKPGDEIIAGECHCICRVFRAMTSKPHTTLQETIYMGDLIGC